MRRLILLILILNLSCKSQSSTPELKANFSADQIADLKKITKFFESQICKNDQTDFKSCFEPILPDLINVGYEPIVELLDFQMQKEFYNSIGKTTFNEIWNFCETTNLKTNKNYQSICAKGLESKYADFLVAVGQNNKFVKKYADRLITSGDFESSTLLQQWIYTNKESFDLVNPNIKLIIAIHFLSINDQEKRTEQSD
ncbi:hypothetical protein [Ascidiimonas sp. W6]|uniref:hypothetical protein n=1 Tax=Ascidiimonas meishanensis TaxID=3128903 RepID=UPI0030EF7CC0